MKKPLLASNVLLAAGFTYFGASQAYQDAAPIWLAMLFFGGLFSAVVVFALFED